MLQLAEVWMPAEGRPQGQGTGRQGVFQWLMSSVLLYFTSSVLIS